MSIQPQRYSLKTWLTVPVIAAFFALGTATFVYLQHEIRSYLVAEFDANLETRLRFFVGLTKFDAADPEEGVPLPEVEFDFEPHQMPEFGRVEQPAYFELWQAGESLARSGSLGAGHLPLATAPPDQLVVRDHRLPDGRAGRIAMLGFLPVFDEDWGDTLEQRAQTFSRDYPDLQRPLMTIAVALSREPLDDTLGYVTGLLGIGLFSLMLVVSLLIWLGATLGLKPLSGLVRQLDQIRGDRLDVRIEESGLPREVAPLAGTMNQLLVRLEQAFERERLFSRNIAHELRTPIAELLSIGEVGARWPDDPEANARFFEDIGRIAHRMDLIISNLLMMARQESGQMVCQLEPVDLGDALRATSERFRSEMKEEGVDLTLAAPEHLLVQADRVCLDIVLSNLASNAIHHGGPDGERRAEVTRHGESVELVFENPANGLSDEDLPHIFNRFWRKDSARSVGRHVGLGLPLVRSLAEACGWQVRVELTPSHRFRIAIGRIRLAPG